MNREVKLPLSKKALQMKKRLNKGNFNKGVMKNRIIKNEKVLTLRLRYDYGGGY